MSQRLLDALVVITTALVVIALFALLWRGRTSPRSAWISGLTGVVLAAWAITTGVLASSGSYQPHDTHSPPPIGVQLATALAIQSACLWLSPTLRGLLRNRKNLIRLNVWRLAGAIFLALMLAGRLPALWAIPAGVGDVLLGVLDLVVAIGLGITTNPGPAQLFHTTPNTELLTRFPLALVPGFLVPLAFMVHFVSLWQLRREFREVPG